MARAIAVAARPQGSSAAREEKEAAAATAAVAPPHPPPPAAAAAAAVAAVSVSVACSNDDEALEVDDGQKLRHAMVMVGSHDLRVLVRALTVVLEAAAAVVVMVVVVARRHLHPEAALRNAALPQRSRCHWVRDAHCAGDPQ